MLAQVDIRLTVLASLANIHPAVSVPTQGLNFITTLSYQKTERWGNYRTICLTVSHNTGVFQMDGQTNGIMLYVSVAIYTALYADGRAIKTAT